MKIERPFPFHWIGSSSSSAERRDDFVGAEARTGSQWHRGNLPQHPGALPIRVTESDRENKIRDGACGPAPATARGSMRAGGCGSWGGSGGA